MWLKVKRIGLFAATHFILILQLFILMSFFCYFTGRDLPPFSPISLFCLVISMGTSLTVLALSKTMVLYLKQVKIIHPHTSDPIGQQLIQMISELSLQGKLEHKPELGIYESEEVRAFTLGPSKDNCLIALSTGLLRKMTKEQVHALIAHEVGHIVNGNMVNFILLQGVVQPILFLIKAIIELIITIFIPFPSFRSQFLRSQSKLRAEMTIQFICVFLLLLFFQWFSRHKELVADKWALQWVSSLNLISAIQVLATQPAPIDAKQSILHTFKNNVSNRNTFNFFPFLFDSDFIARINSIKSYKLSTNTVFLSTEINQK